VSTSCTFTQVTSMLITSSPISKQAKATNPAQVSRKLALLKLYLNAMLVAVPSFTLDSGLLTLIQFSRGQHDQVQRHPQPFRTISSLAARGVPAANLVFPSTPLGSEIWYEATKESKSWFNRSSSSRNTSSSSSSLSGYSLY